MRVTPELVWGCHRATPEMRILFLAHRVPYPPNKGDKIRSYHEVRFLGARHEVWLACLADDAADLPHLETLAGLCRAVACERIGRRAARGRAAARLVRGGQMSVGYFFNRRLARTVSRWLETEQFDVVLAFSSTMAQYVWPRAEGDALPRVMDLVDVDSEKFRAYSRGGVSRAARRRAHPSALTPSRCRPARWVYAAEARRLARYETEIARQFDRVLVVSEAEREVFERVTGGARHGPAFLPPLAVPNGVDVDYFAPGDERPWPNTMVFAGALDYPPNVDAVTWLVQAILPRVRSRMMAASAGQVRLRIVGAKPIRAVRRLARMEGVEVLANVPDIRPYVRSAAVSLAPLRIARGVQNKVLEAMAMGVPVVTTTAGLEGLGCRPGEEVLVADEAETFAEAATRVLSQSDLARRLGRRGRAYCVAHHVWETSMGTLEAVLTEVVERARGKPASKEAGREPGHGEGRV